MATNVLKTYHHTSQQHRILTENRELIKRIALTFVRASRHWSIRQLTTPWSSRLWDKNVVIS